MPGGNSDRRLALQGAEGLLGEGGDGLVIEHEDAPPRNRQPDPSEPRIG